MSQESKTPDPVALVRRQLDALDRRDLDGVMSSVAEETVLDGRALGDHFEGRTAIRAFLEDWFRAWEELAFELEQVSDLGGGVVFAIVSQDGRLVGGDGRVGQREGWVYLWEGGSIARFTVYEVDQGRAAAERLAGERRQAVSERNLELVRRTVTAMNDRNLSDETFATLCTPDFMFENAPTAVTDKTYRGASGVREWVAEFTEAFAPGARCELGEVLVASEELVLARLGWSGHGARSGAPLALRWVGVWWFRDGKLCRGGGYATRREALEAVGLEG